MKGPAIILALLLSFLSGCTDTEQGSQTVRDQPRVSELPTQQSNVRSSEKTGADLSATADLADESGTSSAVKGSTSDQQEIVDPQVPQAVAEVGQYRLPDDRPSLDEARLRNAGISVIRSKHLVLLTDVPENLVSELPAVADELFVVLESALGKLRPARDQSDFQVTGCLMEAAERFESAGLMPDSEIIIRHGRHLNYRFWMRNPPSDYYRRHLLLHEFTHCFMMCEFGMQDIPPLWYTEGLPEYFATHLMAAQSSDHSSTVFGVLPGSTDAFHGWGRISELRRSFDNRPALEAIDAGFTSLKAVMSPPDSVFLADSKYAHAWALYWLLQHHPSYQPLFEPLRRVRRGTDYLQIISAVSEEEWNALAVDWLLTLDSITEGFDLSRSFPTRSAKRLTGNLDLNQGETTISVQADSEWQYSGLLFRTGQKISIHASGTFRVAQDPRPWISEPQGITIDYFRGRALGELCAILVAPDGSLATRRISIGRQHEFNVPFDSQLWLQLNDSAALRQDNEGHAEVTISADVDSGLSPSQNN